MKKHPEYQEIVEIAEKETNPILQKLLYATLGHLIVGDVIEESK